MHEYYRKMYIFQYIIALWFVSPWFEIKEQIYWGVFWSRIARGYADHLGPISTKVSWAHNSNPVKIHVVLSWKLIIQSDQNFAHAMIVQLSLQMEIWHLIWSFKIVIMTKRNLDNISVISSQTFCEIDPGYHLMLSAWCPIHSWNFHQISEFDWIYLLIFLQYEHNHNEISHISRQLCFLGICKILLWSGQSLPCHGDENLHWINFHYTRNLMEISMW